LNGNRLEANYDGTEITIDAQGRLIVGGVPAPKITAGQLGTFVTLLADQIIGGTIASNVVYAGAIEANQVNAGLFYGHELELVKNGITTKIRNDTADGFPAGLRSEDAYSNRVLAGISNYIPRLYLRSATYGGSATLEASSGGRLILTDSSGTSGIEADGNYLSETSWKGRIVSGAFYAVHWLYVAGQFRSAYQVENLVLGNLTATKWIAAYDSFGNWLGKIPIIP